MSGKFLRMIFNWKDLNFCFSGGVWRSPERSSSIWARMISQGFWNCNYISIRDIHGYWISQGTSHLTLAMALGCRSHGGWSEALLCLCFTFSSTILHQLSYFYTSSYFTSSVIQDYNHSTEEDGQAAAPAVAFILQRLPKVALHIFYRGLEGCVVWTFQYWNRICKSIPWCVKRGIFVST